MIADGRGDAEKRKRAGEPPRRPPKAPKLKSAAQSPETPGDGLESGELFSDPAFFRGDCRIVQAALGRRLPVDVELFSRLVKRAAEIVESQKNPRARDLDRLARLLVSAERVNVAAEAAGLLVTPPDEDDAPAATPQDVLDLLDSDARFRNLAAKRARGE